MVEPELLTVQEVCDIIGMTGPAAGQTVRRWIREGQLEAIDFKGRIGYRVPRAALDRFIAERSTRKQIRRAADDVVVKAGL